jgi:hypothetical protein
MLSKALAVANQLLLLLWLSPIPIDAQPHYQLILGQKRMHYGDRCIPRLSNFFVTVMCEVIPVPCAPKPEPSDHPRDERSCRSCTQPSIIRRAIGSTGNTTRLPTHMASLVAYLVSKAAGVLGPSVALGVQRLVLRLVASAADP